MKQLEFVGNKSAVIICTAGLFTGAVLGLQLGVIFLLFSAESLIGATTGKALASNSPLLLVVLLSQDVQQQQ